MNLGDAVRCIFLLGAVAGCAAGRSRVEQEPPHVSPRPPRLPTRVEQFEFQVGRAVRETLARTYVRSIHVPPFVESRFDPRLRITVQLALDDRSAILETHVVRPSGFRDFDEAIAAALRTAGPFGLAPRSILDAQRHATVDIDLLRDTLVGVPRAHVAAPDADDSVGLRLTLAGPGQMTVTNTTDHAVTLSPAVRLERTRERVGDTLAWESFIELEPIELVETCGPEPLRECVTLSSGQSLTIARWTGFNCLAQCNMERYACHRNFCVGDQPVRFVVAACDGSFEVPTDPIIPPCHPGNHPTPATDRSDAGH